MGTPFYPWECCFSFLIIPAIFAGQVAPHSPREGEVLERLQPPVWVGDKVVDGVLALIVCQSAFNAPEPGRKPIGN